MRIVARAGVGVTHIEVLGHVEAGTSLSFSASHIDATATRLVWAGVG